MKTILELSHIKARQYFLESQNYCNMQFPSKRLNKSIFF